MSGPYPFVAGSAAVGCLPDKVHIQLVPGGQHHFLPLDEAELLAARIAEVLRFAHGQGRQDVSPEVVAARAQQAAQPPHIVHTQRAIYAIAEVLGMLHDEISGAPDMVRRNAVLQGIREVCKDAAKIRVD